MKGYIALALLLVLAGCGQQPQHARTSSAAASQRGDACTAFATRNWAIGQQTYRVDASAHGPTCGAAQVTLVLRAPDDGVLFSKTYRTSEITLSFNPTADQSVLNDDLNLWIENQAPGADASALPEWPADAERPPHFQPAVARSAYERARAARQALYCYPDGGESNACVAVDTAAHAAALLGSRTPEHP
ncbi:MAG TPA: hypothetical protein VG841_12920 [Caulobacterales bacterium]|nr:hypothetical protein [Caulobacterales bacterium]